MLDQTTVALLYTTERLDIDNIEDNLVSTSTVIRNLKFDIDRPTRYYNDVRIHSYARESHGAFAF